MQDSKQRIIIILYNDIVSFLSYHLCNDTNHSQKVIPFAFMMSLILDCSKSQLTYVVSKFSFKTIFFFIVVRHFSWVTDQYCKHYLL